MPIEPKDLKSHGVVVAVMIAFVASFYGVIESPEVSRGGSKPS